MSDESQRPPQMLDYQHPLVASEQVHRAPNPAKTTFVAGLLIILVGVLLVDLRIVLSMLGTAFALIGLFGLLRSFLRRIS